MVALLEPDYGQLPFTAPQQSSRRLTNPTPTSCGNAWATTAPGLPWKPWDHCLNDAAVKKFSPYWCLIRQRILSPIQRNVSMATS